ncbi:MAG TPA: tannase/feruloyl esterase family alpha/beta hydrolase [Solirubrobacteraceae bacterium]|nr:tannase/feruloyl esterase family alpha/beta hydrolase [Solirubrobacteraceae bacterium]
MLERVSARHAWGIGALATAVAVALLLFLGSAGGGTAAASSRPLVVDSAKLVPISPKIPAKETCASIATLASLAGLPRYPTAIASATVVPASAGTATTPANPEYCNVQGMIAPQTHFDLQLPLNTWQGRYLQNGCGGYCGTVSGQTFPTCDATLQGDFAMATDDEGHVTAAGLGGGGLFAFNDEKLRTEYGYQSEQALYVVARYIINYFYGQDPNYSYFNGCSDGGREAMEMAERYPDDFNGIIAGAPEIYAGPLNAEEQTWNYKVNTDSNGNAILTDNKLPALEAAVVNACGGDDGVAGDGIITDPQDCHFNPASIECPAGTDNNSCLTAAQVQVVREYYEGPTDPQGQRLYPGGVPYGSEGGWSVFELPPSSNGGSVPTTESLDYSGLSQPYLRYQLLQPGQLGPDPSQWQFTAQDFRSMFPVADTWDALDTNLSAFERHGGKLIMWQGWADNGIPPTGTVDYYDTLVSRNGGLSSTEQFARLFMEPTVYHCGGGYASAVQPDLILPIVEWVETGTAPGGDSDPLTISYTVGSNSLSRPLYPYPDIPKYDGSGPTSDASSFHAVVAPAYANHTDYTNWIGNNLLYQPIGGGQGREEGYARRG